MKKTLLAIPVYNCEKQILRVLDSIKKYLNNGYPLDIDSDIKLIFQKKGTTSIKVKTLIDEYGLREKEEFIQLLGEGFITDEFKVDDTMKDRVKGQYNIDLFDASGVNFNVNSIIYFFVQ